MRVALLALLASCAHPPHCPAVQAGDGQVEFERLCAEHRLVCLPDERVATSVAVTRRYSLAYSPTRCGENLPLCRFVFWHELSHYLFETSETDSDCYAARKADKAAVTSALCSLPASRAARIQQCDD